jgi:hypothetical protein
VCSSACAQLQVPNIANVMRRSNIDPKTNVNEEFIGRKNIK